MLSSQIWQYALLKQSQLRADGLAAFAFQHLQEQGEFGHFHGLRVNIHAKDVVEQDFFLLCSR